MMKTLLTVSLAAVAAFFLAPVEAEAGQYKTKIVGKCGKCGKNLRAVYKPYRLPCGTVRYQWVRQNHSCQHRAPSYSHSYPSRSYVRPTYPSFRPYNPYSPFGSYGGGGIVLRFGSSGYCR
ncbi:MAG: hypothetical protein AAGC68_04330 [Verrucomicrobiota bacterium]